MPLINNNINIKWDQNRETIERSLGWSDVDINLSQALDGDVIKNKNIDAVKNSIYNILNTVQGERRMLPTFALPIFNLLFEPVNKETGQRIAELIIEAINNWDDRPIVKSLDIKAEPDNNMYRCTLIFTVKGRISEQKIDFILYQN